MSSEENERLTSLEIKFSYLEDFMNQLQEVTVGLSRQLDSLSNDNEEMKNRIKDMANMLEGDIPNRKPPHY